MEAEGTAYVVGGAEDVVGGAEDSRGCLQHWRRDQPIDEAAARRIFKAADQIFAPGGPRRD